MHPTVLNLKVSGESNADVKAPGSGFRTGGKLRLRFVGFFMHSCGELGSLNERNLRRWEQVGKP